jgi:hypothetical protein
LNNEIDEIINGIIENPPATGEGQFVAFTSEMQQKYQIAPFGTMEIKPVTGGQKTVYRAGPRHLAEHKSGIEVNVPSLQGFVEAFVANETCPSLVDLMPDEIDISIKGPKDKTVTIASYLESWLFKFRPTFVLIDPAQGSLWRALEADIGVYVLLTSKDSQWRTSLEREFQSAFAQKKQLFEFIDFSSEKLDEHIVYHGQNGLKDIVTPMSVALEPNPYSVDMREQGLGVTAISSDVYKMVYQRKTRLVEYNFSKIPNHFRVDPLSLMASAKIKGDSFFLALNFDPEIFKVCQPVREMKALGDTIAYDMMPPYVQSGPLMVSEDHKYVYDVQLKATCASRRNFCSSLARAKGKQIAPISDWGRFVAYPYSTRFHNVGIKKHGNILILESESMSSECYKIENKEYYVASEHDGVAFVKNDFNGRPLTPFEKYGTVHPVPTYLAQSLKTRYPDISGLGKEAIVFSSFNCLLENISLIGQFVCGDIASVIVTNTKMPEKPIFDDMVDDDTDTKGFMSGDHENKSVRQRLVEWYENDNSPKTLKEISAAYPWVQEREVVNILLYLPTFIPMEIEDQIMWVDGMDIDFEGDGECGSLGYHLNASSLKNSLVVSPDLSYIDQVSLDVSDRLKFIDLCGYELVSTKRSGEYVQRVFRRC